MGTASRACTDGCAGAPICPPPNDTICTAPSTQAVILFLAARLRLAPGPQRVAGGVPKQLAPERLRRR